MYSCSSFGLQTDTLLSKRAYRFERDPFKWPLGNFFTNTKIWAELINTKNQNKWLNPFVVLTNSIFVGNYRNFSPFYKSFNMPVAYCSV